MRGTFKRIGVLLALAAALVFTAVAAGSGGVGNGDFEHGDFTNWSTDNLGLGEWSVYSGKQTPNVGAPISKPPQGTYAAVTDEASPSAMVLYRTLHLSTSKPQQVSFYVYYRSYADFDPGNQEYRIDIMDNSADPFSTDSGDILMSLFRTKPGNPTTKSPTLKTYPLTGLTGDVMIRLLVIAGDNELNGAVDNVRLGSAA
jgi:hypothetical protein